MRKDLQIHSGNLVSGTLSVEEVSGAAQGMIPAFL
jgi:hypothetical protein